MARSGRAALTALAGFAAVTALAGCSTTGYLWQAGRGQLAMLNRARPIGEVLRDEKTPPRIRELLAEIEPIKKYGEGLGIKPTRNYTEFVKLDRPYAVWVVSGSEKLRFRAKEWSFPFVGSFPYLGWYDLEDARRFAASLKEEGWDVDLRGARAYSTLGWFRDAVLSSMIPPGPEAFGEVVNVILHESVHATLYVSGQSFFDESVASFVADRLTPEYLKARGKHAELEAYQKGIKDSEAARRRLHEAYESLDQVYRSQATDAEKLTKKTALLTALQTELGWKREITNATLFQYKTYNTGTPDFEGLFAACGSDWGRFWSVLMTLGPESFSKPQQEDLAAVLGPLRAKCR
jgi:predicted aminopeptidase